MATNPTTLAMNTNIYLDALTSPLGLTCLAIIGACAVGLLIGLIVMRRVHRDEPATDPIRDADGTATIEFALVFPILLFMMLILTQTTWLMGGNIFVHYSAFAASRAAIVQIPEAYPDDAANQYTASEYNTKHHLIWRSAVFALAPVGGEQTQSVSTVAAAEFVEGLSRFYASYGRNHPVWVDTLMANRLRYAADNTRIAVMIPQVQGNGDAVSYEEIPDGGRHQFNARDPITVRVAHRLNLGVPYVNRVYADGQVPGTNSRYRLVTARYTLTNEGVRDELPPQPTVPRDVSRP